MADSKVLARVEGKEITESEVKRFIQHLGPQVAMQFQGPEGMKQVAQELVNQELMYLEAKDKGLDQEEEYLKEVEVVKENVLKQYAISKILQSVEVTEDDLKEFYEDHKDFYKKEETISASHILVEDEEKANEIVKEIEEGLSFEEAAQKYSSCPSKDMGGSLGEFGKGRMVPEFEEAAFELEVDKVSEPVQSQFGYHIIKVTDKSEAGISPFEEVKAQIMQQVTAMKQQEAYLGKATELQDQYDVELFLD